MTFDEILRCFKSVTKTGEGYTALCPAHDDRARSLSIKNGNDRALVNCFAGCSAEQIAASINLKISDLFYEPRPDRKLKIVEKPPPPLTLMAGTVPLIVSPARAGN